MAQQVHRVRFYNLEPNSIKCMSLEKQFKLLAISREDNSIEIWNICNSPHIETTIFGTFGTVESLGWYNKRLFSVGLQGSIIEYDLLKQAPKTMYPVSSSPCWCLSVHRTKKQLVAGTDDGYINVFDIHDEELVYNKIMDKQEGRISCISWDKSGEYLITGSIDTIRVWKVSAGHAVHRFVTGRHMNLKETMVWTLAVTDDFTIISGDSRGKLCFWDGNTGVNITSYQSHKADILTVCLDEDQNIVYCAGVDPLIVSYERVKMRGNEEQVKWVKSIQRAIHDHDVRCMIVSGSKLFSAGVDGYLALSSYPPKVLIKYPPLLQPPCAELAPEMKYMLLRYPTSVNIWELDVGKDPVKLLDWRPPSDIRVKCASISSNGQWFACSTQERFRLYSIKLVKHRPQLTKVKINTKKCLASQYITFSGDSKSVSLATLEGKICELDLENCPPTIKYTLNPLKDKYFHDNLGKITVSKNAKYLVASDLSSNIIVWLNGEYYCKLPVHKCPVTAMAIQPETNNLVIVYSDHRLFEYSLENKKYTKFSRQLQERYPKEWLNRNFPVHNITFITGRSNIIILNDDSAILVINKDKELPVSNLKIPRLCVNNGVGASPTRDTSDGGGPLSPSTSTPSNSSFNIVKRYKHLVYFGELCTDEMVAVEVSPVTLKERLPQTLRKLFGRM